MDAHRASQLKFFNTHAGLADKRAFKRFLAPLRHIKWVVYCKAPFAGPRQVLRYLSRYTHRVAISNRRLVAADDAGIAFRWKDYRANGTSRWKTMRLHPHEFIRRFLADGVDAAESLMQLVLDRHFRGGKHLLLGADRRFWHYDVRLWHPVQEDWVSGKVLDILQTNPVKGQRTASLLNQVLTLLRAKLAVETDPLGFLADPPPVINCQNGELLIAADGKVKLRQHKPKSYLRHCLDVAYDPEAKCPEYDRALKEIFAKSNKPKAMARHWNELSG
jgi:hypothetical protein